MITLGEPIGVSGQAAGHLTHGGRLGWRRCEHRSAACEEVPDQEVAASVIATIPAIILFALIERKVVRGLTAESIK